MNNFVLGNASWLRLATRSTMSHAFPQSIFGEPKTRNNQKLIKKHSRNVEKRVQTILSGNLFTERAATTHPN
jgi:hypothetical protein